MPSFFRQSRLFGQEITPAAHLFPRLGLETGSVTTQCEQDQFMPVIQLEFHGFRRNGTAGRILFHQFLQLRRHIPGLFRLTGETVLQFPFPDGKSAFQAYGIVPGHGNLIQSFRRIMQIVAL